MSDKPQPHTLLSTATLKTLSPHDWDSLIDDFQHGGPRRHRWISSTSSIVDQALSSFLKRDLSLPLKLSLLLFLDEFSEFLFVFDSNSSENPLLNRLIHTVRSVLQTPTDAVHVSFALKEQFMVSATSIFISIDLGLGRILEGLVELLLTVINRPNYGPDRQSRAVACECLRELERAYPCLLSEIAGHLWSWCQNERTHASQSYILLFTSVIHNIVAHKLSVSILNTSVPLVPFIAPLISKESSGGLNYKELRRAMAFLLEWPQILTPCAMVEFMSMVMPVALALELQASMFKVQFFGMIYSYDPMLCHVVLTMWSQFLDAFDGQEGEIARRLMWISRETHHFIVFRLLSIHWLLGFCELVFRRDVKKMKPIVEMSLKFYPSVFDPLALKALKLDLLCFCCICLDVLKSVNGLIGDEGPEKLIVNTFEDGIISVSAFKWLPAGSSETSVAFRTFHKFLIGASSHSDGDPSTTRSLMDSRIFCTLQGMLVDIMLECQRLVPVIVVFLGRLWSCKKHSWLGERLLQTFDEHLLSKVKLDFKLVFYFPLFNRIAENDTIPPRGLIELLTKFMVFLVEKHDPITGLKSWSQGSKVLGICRTLLMHHSSSRLFLKLSRLLVFTCLYFPDLEVRDNARIYLRMLICVPGRKLREMLNLGEQLIGISPSHHSSSFFNIQSPRYSYNAKKSRNISSYVHLQRAIPLLVKQTWSLSLSSLYQETNKPDYVVDIGESEPTDDEKENDGGMVQIIPATERIEQPQAPLLVMDSKISEILGTLRRHFSCIPDFRHMRGLKVIVSCRLMFESEPFNRVWGVGSPGGASNKLDNLPALYATVLKFSSSAPYGSIPSYNVPFLLGEPSESDNNSGQQISLDIVPLGNGLAEEERFRAPVTIELEPREPTPGLVDVCIETNTENGEIIRGQLHSVSVGIEDMFLKPTVPPNVQTDAIPDYYSHLFSALWVACDTSCSTGRETFPLKGGKGLAAINGTRSVKLLEIPASSLIQAIEQYLAPFVVCVIGEPLCSLVKDDGIIRDISWKDVPDSSPDDSTLRTDFNTGPLHLTYIQDVAERDISVNVSKRNLGCFHILIFLPPRFHLLFQMEVSDVSTLVRIRTDHWPCLAYIDDYLEALFLAQ